MRYLRVFSRALHLTLRGESAHLAVLRKTHPELADWCLESIHKVEAVFQASRRANINPETVIVKVDGRDQTMMVILQTIHFHAEQEYAYLIRGGDRFSGMTLQAININDQFAVRRLIEKLPIVLRTEIELLANHLDNLPNMTN